MLHVRIIIIIIKKKNPNDHNLSDKQKTIKCVRDAHSGSSRCANPWTVAKANPRVFFRAPSLQRHVTVDRIWFEFIHFTPAC